MLMSNPSYLEAINWISQHDNPEYDEPIEALMRYLTVQLTAFLFDRSIERVAKDVWIDRHR
jgi:uncharacterized protein with PIN domain